MIIAKSRTINSKASTTIASIHPTLYNNIMRIVRNQK
jgi:hypothetical protein